ncbi:MAG TPA: hypothetical protein VHU81_12335 [Thermoanaerobaculia bacterium]|jgi:hypothetical protein|nr:hypothetical protein [Thermoanaerobaculia bacterium]
MSRKLVLRRWIGLALVAALAVAAPAGAAGFSGGGGAVPTSPSMWSQAWAWVLGGLQMAGAPVAPLVTAFGKVGMHIDPNGTEPTSDPSGNGGISLGSGNISVTVDPAQ